jgi:hypothetical protein
MAEVKDNLLQLDKVVGDLNKRLDENIDKIDRLAVVYNKFSKESANAPSQYVNVLNDTKKAVDGVNESQKKLEQTEKQLQKTRLDELRLQKQREQAFDKYEKQLASENAKLQAASNTYNKLQVELNKLNNTYKDLATRKAQGATLTKVEAEQMTYLEKRIKQHDTTLKAVDATMGKYQRNVGNYAGAFNPLSNSINQLSREMPAFANSVQTGFMAISNNLPIFFDAIGNIRKENAALRAENKPTQSVFKQLASAIFSWGTALSVGVTLLTLYGKDIVEFTKNAFRASSGIKSISEQQDELNSSIKKGMENSAEEVGKLDVLYRKSNDVSLSMKERKKAVDDLQNLYPAYFANINDEIILNGKAENAYKNLRNAIVAKYMAEAVGVQLQENASKRFKEEFSLIQDIAFLREKINKNYGKTYLTEAGTREDVNTEAYQELFKAEQKLKAVRQSMAKDDQLLIQMQSDYLKQSALLVESEKKSTKSTTEKVKAKKQEKEVTEKLDKVVGLNIDKLKLQTDTEKELKDAIAEKIAELNKSIKTTEDAKKALEDFQNQYRQGFIDEFVSQSGFDKLFFLVENFDKLKESGTDTALAISEAFQQAFNTISNASQQNFDAEYSRLEQQKTVSMQFAGESAAAKEEIERQYETRKKEIQRREAEAQKRLAMFNIITNTAQAIMAAAPKVPLMIAMGAIGALQLAMVASQQIPQFWKGTDNAPEGLAWTQERGAEVITDSKGNVKTYGNNKGAQLTYLNKGDKVYKSHTDYINKELSKNGIQPIGQSFSSVNISNGLTKEDLSEEITRLSRTISQKENISINIDKKGFKTAVNGKNYINNRLILKGRSV